MCFSFWTDCSVGCITNGSRLCTNSLQMLAMVTQVELCWLCRWQNVCVCIQLTMYVCVEGHIHITCKSHANSCRVKSLREPFLFLSFYCILTSKNGNAILFIYSYCFICLYFYYHFNFVSYLLIYFCYPEVHITFFIRYRFII